MERQEYLTIPELARLLGLSRIAVYKKVRKGEIKATRIGRNYAIPKKSLGSIRGTSLSEAGKLVIEKAVRKTVQEYGELLRLLGRE